MARVSARRPRHRLLGAAVAIVLAQWLIGPVIIAIADEPQPDPAGIATGDKTDHVPTPAATRSSSPNRPIRPLRTTPQEERRSTTIRPRRRKSRWR